MIRLYITREVCPEEHIVYALRGQLSRSHLRQIVYLDAPLARDFSRSNVAQMRTFYLAWAIVQTAGRHRRGP